MKKGVSILLLTILFLLFLIGSVYAGKPVLIDNTEKMQEALENNPLDPTMIEKPIECGKSGLTVIVDPLEVFAD